MRTTHRAELLAHAESAGSVAAVLLVVAGANTNTPAANLVLASSAAIYLTFAVVWSAWSSGSREYATWMSYLSVAIDLTFCHALAISCLYNHSGVYELYRSPALWLVLAAANALTACCWKSAVCWSPRADRALQPRCWLGERTTPVSWWLSQLLGEGLNLFEVFEAQLFAVVPALIASTISHAPASGGGAAQRERAREMSARS